MMKLLNLLALTTLFCSLVRADEPAVVTVTDNTFGYAFQHPSDWKVTKAPKGDEFGGRFTLTSPGGTLVQTLVGNVDATLPQGSLEKNPDSNALIEKFLDFTVETVHRKASREMGAESMTVQKKERVPSKAGLQFFISTLHKFKGPRAIIVSGISVIPYGKPQMISFFMNIKVGKDLAKEADTLRNVFNSFHLLKEREVSNSK